MPDQPRLTDAALEALLADARAVAFPPTPPIPSGALRMPRREPRMRAALLAAAIATLLLAGAALGAAALGIGPLRIWFTSALPSPNVPDQPLAVRLSLGQRTSLADPAIAVPLLVPDGVGPPDEVYRSDDGRRVSLVWGARDDLPATGGSRIGLLVMALAGSIEPELVEKVATEFDVTVELVTVRGGPGYWISGEPHLLRFRDATGAAAERSRLVGDTLVWSEAGTVYRLESALGRDATLALSETLRAP